MSRLWIIVLIAIVITVTTTASAQEVWRKSIMMDDPVFSENYSAEIPGGNCSVVVKKDGTGVLLFAYDYHWHNKVAYNMVNVSSDGNKLSIKNQTCVITNEGDLHYGSNYYVFEVKCMGIARQLPPEVKEKFYGYGGINY